MFSFLNLSYSPPHSSTTVYQKFSFSYLYLFCSSILNSPVLPCICDSPVLPSEISSFPLRNSPVHLFEILIFFNMKVFSHRKFPYFSIGPLSWPIWPCDLFSVYYGPFGPVISFYRPLWSRDLFL